MIFDYVERKTSRGDSYWTPTVVVQITTPTLRVMAEADVDTGADRTMIPISGAAQLGVNLEDCDPHTITGSDGTAYAPAGDWFVTVKGGFQAPIRPLFYPFPRMCLGMDYLAHFRATFDGPSRQLTLEPA